MPQVSIIVPSFNKEKYISETINSVINQFFSDWELIIVDDLSTDATPEIIKTFAAKDNRIIFFRNKENEGANYSRNFGLKVATGKYILFLDADDLLLSTCLENRINEAKENYDGNLFVFGMGVFQKQIRDDNRKWIPNATNALTDFLQHKLPWQTMQPLWKKDFLVSLNGFDEKFERLQDVELHTRALLNSSVKLYQFPEIIDCYYRVDEERKNFNEFEFLHRRMKASVMYCDKFGSLVSIDQKRFLLGTIVQSYLSIIYSFRYKKVSERDFSMLKELLFSVKVMEQVSFIKQILFKILYFYNYYFVRISGTNYLISKMIVA